MSLQEGCFKMVACIPHCPATQTVINNDNDIDNDNDDDDDDDDDDNDTDTDNNNKQTLSSS